MGCPLMNKIPLTVDSLTPNDRKGLKSKAVQTHGELNQLEYLNIGQCILWLKSQKIDDVLNISFIKLLHKKMFGDVWNWAGKFRLHETNIGIHPSKIQEQALTLLNDAEYWNRFNTYSPLESAARFHFRIEQIHLFPNGNGRHGRLMTDLYLQKVFGCPPIKWLDLDRFGSEEIVRQHYFSALRAADAHDFEPLLKFVGAK